MSRFYGSVLGAAKNAATRRGFKNIEAHVRGWDFGVSVEGFVTEDGKECFHVLQTGGSNNPKTKRLIAILMDQEVATI